MPKKKLSKAEKKAKKLQDATDNLAIVLDRAQLAVNNAAPEDDVSVLKAVIEKKRAARKAKAKARRLQKVKDDRKRKHANLTPEQIQARKEKFQRKKLRRLARRGNGSAATDAKMPAPKTKIAFE